MNVLITGAAGFLGSHLTDAYLRAGAHVYGVDDYSSGLAQNLSAARESSHWSFLEADIAVADGGLPAWLDAQGVRIDLVFHLASPASPPRYIEAPLRTLAANSAGTDACCRIALTHGARMVFASTSEIYGDPAEHPQRETYNGNVNPGAIRSCYDEGKRFGEAMCAAYARGNGLDVRVARIFNTYGPRMRADDGRVIPTFIAAAQKVRPFPISGNGTQTRSFCYVDDLVAGLQALAAAPDARARTVNLGNPEEVTMLALAQLVAQVYGVEARFAFGDLMRGDPARRCPEISLARELLGWTPRVPLAAGLRRLRDLG